MFELFDMFYFSIEKKKKKKKKTVLTKNWPLNSAQYDINPVPQSFCWHPLSGSGVESFLEGSNLLLLEQIFYSLKKRPAGPRSAIGRTPDS